MIKNKIKYNIIIFIIIWILLYIIQFYINKERQIEELIISIPIDSAAVPGSERIKNIDYIVSKLKSKELLTNKNISKQCNITNQLEYLNFRDRLIKYEVTATTLLIQIPKKDHGDCLNSIFDELDKIYTARNNDETKEVMNFIKLYEKNIINKKISLNMSEFIGITNLQYRIENGEKNIIKKISIEEYFLPKPIGSLNLIIIITIFSVILASTLEVVYRFIKKV